MTALLALGCGSPPAVKRVVERWITEEPSRPDPAIPIFQEIEGFHWRFRTAEEIAAWTPINIDRNYELTDRGLFLRSRHPDPILVREVDLQAERISVIRVHQSGADNLILQLYWAGEGESFSEERSMKAEVKEPGSTLVSVYSFRVTEHPLWKGKIRRLRFDPSSLPERRVELIAMVGVRYEVDPDRLAAAVSRPWRIDLSSDARSALLAPPGASIARELELPAPSELRLAIGLQQDRGPPVTFRVAVQEQGGEPQELFSRRLDPEDDSQRRRWFDVALNLERFAGRKVRILLETSAAEPVNLLRGFPVWAQPEVVARAPGASPPPNLVIILIDTLRADHLSLYGYERPTSPAIDAWARSRGVVFRNVVAPAPWTLPSHVSLFTGLGSVGHGVNHTSPAPASLTMLAERLRAAGYTTAGFTGGAYLSPGYGLAQGFDRFDYWIGRHPTREPEPGKDLAEGMEKILRWLGSAAPQPFFLFVHTYEVHTPFQAREPYFSQFVGSEPGRGPLPEVSTQLVPAAGESGWRLRSRFTERIEEPKPHWAPLAPIRQEVLDALYDSGIAYVDAQIDRLLDQLRALGLEENTLVVFTSDHGEALGENDSTSHENLYDFNLLVPLVMAFPGGRWAGESIPTQVRLIDVAPTLLDYLGLATAESMDGSSLLPLLDDPDTAFPSLALSCASSTNYGLSLRVANRWKYIYQNAAWQPLQGREELFDLSEDPAESANLAAAETRRSENFLGQLKQLFDEQSSNLRVNLRNSGPVPLIVNLYGDLAHAFTVKGFELPADGLTWNGSTRVEVPPDSGLSLYLEGAPVGELGLSVGTVTPDGVRANHSRVLKLEDLKRPWRLVLVDGVWKDAAAQTAGIAAVEVEWVGELQWLPSEDPTKGNEQLREQLRELGYIE
ncbi:MAG: sulfatase-like hydrolase/transferase [bacterium]|nr:sulfatase-like hydrolase/transferase [bacterium]